MANEQTLPVSPRDMLRPNEISAFCTQIAMILKSGIPVSEGIGIMAEDVKNLQGRQLLEAVHEQVDAGYPLHQALRAARHFPKYMVDMVEIGEATGKLDNVMDSLCDYYEREESVAKSVKSAVTYPLIMIAMMLLVITVLIVKVMPIFNEVFLGLGSEMTGFSRSVLALGQGIGRYSFVIVGAVAVLIVLFSLLRLTRGGRALLDSIRYNSPFTRGLYSKIASGRFASAMALMLASGLDTDQSLEMVRRLIDNKPMQQKIDRCKDYLSKGSTFSEALMRSEIFTGVYARMVTVAFKTGSLDGVMQKLADRYEEEVNTRISGIISVLEPTLVAILSIVVGMILLSVMLPLMGIMSSIG